MVKDSLSDQIKKKYIAVGYIKNRIKKKKGDMAELKQGWELTDNYSGQWFRLVGEAEEGHPFHPQVHSEVWLQNSSTWAQGAGTRMIHAAL